MISVQTRLDRTLFALAEAHPDWVSSLSPEQRNMLDLRRQGVSLQQIAEAYGLSPATVRFRLYGKGMGLKRAGGILGHFRWLHTRIGRERRETDDLGHPSPG